MRKSFKYGTIGFTGAKSGDPVRFVDSPIPGKPGVILVPRGQHEVNAILIKVGNDLGYVEIKSSLLAATAVGEAASASGIKINLPVVAGGSLKIS